MRYIEGSIPVSKMKQFSVVQNIINMKKRTDELLNCSSEKPSKNLKARSNTHVIHPVEHEKNCEGGLIHV